MTGPAGVSKFHHQLPGPSFAGRFLSLACPRERNQREGHPDSAAFRCAEGAWTTAGVRRRCILHRGERARVLRAPLRAFSSAHSPRPRGPEGQEQSKAALPLTLNPCDAAEGGRSGPKGRRDGSRRFRCVHTDVHSAEHRSLTRTFRAGARKAQCQGRASLWLLSLARARESDSLAEGE